MDLVDLKLENLLEYEPDTRTLKANPQIGYYRQPTASEYPLDLNRGHKQYILRNGNFLRAFGVVQHHVMHLKKPRQVLDRMDFFLNRGTMLKFMGDRTYRQETNFAACRFKGCIYVRSLWEDNEKPPMGPNVTRTYPFKARQPMEPNVTRTFPFKARRYVFTPNNHLNLRRLGSPGELPSIDAPVDERKLIYGMFSAKLGKFRLFYSAEVSGVSNKEPLGDLNDPEELKKCRPTSLRVDKHGLPNSYMPLWLMQAYLGGIDQLAIASVQQNGLVYRPIEVVSCAAMMREIQLNIHNRLKKLHEILEEISSKMGNMDNPYQELKFTLVNDHTIFEDHLDAIEPPGNFDQEYIDFITQFDYAYAEDC